jgi:hypothetical protein
MSNIMPSDIATIVETTMRAYSNTGRGKTPLPATAYQWLERLHHHPALDPLQANLRDQLILERGMPGLGSSSRNGYSSAQVVSDALEMLAREGKVEITYHDSEGEQFLVAAQWITPGYTGHAVARYRIL